MTASFPVITLLVVLEAAYIFISLRAIIREKLSLLRNAGLFFGIIAANLGSVIFIGTPFRFLLVAGLIFGLMKLVFTEKVYFYSLFLVIAVYGVKWTIEILLMLVIGFENISASLLIAGGVGLLIFPIAMYFPTIEACTFAGKLFKRPRTFFVRYILVCILIATAMVYLWILTHHAQNTGI